MTNMRGSRLGVIGSLPRRLRFAPLLMWLLIVGYAALYAWLSILRHETFGSGAMDMGYTDQVVWNTLHGRFMQFSTYAGARIDLPLEQFRRTDTLLAYHVELLLAPISLLYLLYDSPITLLALQSVAIALGAWPAFRLARERLQSDLAGLAFGLAYLMAPAIQGAILSDFHAAALAAPLLLYALELAHKRRFRSFFAVVVLAMLAKEDIPLLVMMLGLYLFVVLRERRWGTVTTLTGLVWFFICTLWILPHYNGLSSSPFVYRLAIFGPTLRQSFLNWVAEPSLLLRWLTKPEVTSYLGGLLASAGFLSLLSPLLLGLAAPILAINVFSTWSWTYSEGDHYSASIVPFVIVSAIYGTRFLADRLSARWGISAQRMTAVLVVWVLLIGGIHHYQVGVSPLARQYAPPSITAHDRLGNALMTMIPADAPVSAQSNLYPHLAHREKAYFFPAVNDAEYVFLDVTSTPYPLTNQGLQMEMRSLLRSAEFGVLAAQDGYLLLQRGNPRTDLPQAFYDFARSNEADIAHVVHVQFGDVLELVGYDHHILNVVQAHELPATVTTYWRPLRPVDLDYQFPLFFTRADGAIVFLYEGGSATTVWYPPYDWKVGEIVRMETPILNVGRLRDVLLAVTGPGADPWQPEGRLEIHTSERAGVQVLDGGTLVRVLRFQ